MVMMVSFLKKWCSISCIHTVSSTDWHPGHSQWILLCSMCFSLMCCFKLYCLVYVFLQTLHWIGCSVDICFLNSVHFPNECSHIWQLYNTGSDKVWSANSFFLAYNVYIQYNLLSWTRFRCFSNAGSESNAVEHVSHTCDPFSWDALCHRNWKRLLNFAVQPGKSQEIMGEVCVFSCRIRCCRVVKAAVQPSKEQVWSLMLEWNFSCAVKWEDRL